MSEVNVQIQNPKQTVNINNPVITIEMPTDSITVEILEGQPIEIQVQNPVIEVNIGGPCDCGDGGGGHTIQDEGTDLPAQPKLNFIGAGVTAADNPGNGSTDVTIPGGAGGIIEVTYAEMAALIAAGVIDPADGLIPGARYLITDAAGTDGGFLSIAPDAVTPGVSGYGNYRNADFQAVGDYSGTPETFGTQLGIWRPGFEAVTIPYTNLDRAYIDYLTSSGLLMDTEGYTTPGIPYYIYYTGSSGLFTVGEIITGDDNGSAAIVVSDDGAGTLEVSDVTGDWTTETTFAGDTSTETATFDGYDEGAPGKTGIVITDTGSRVYLIPDQALEIGDVITGDDSGNTVEVDTFHAGGGVFAVGDTITGGTTGATAQIVTDNGASSMTAYMTSAGVAFDGSEVLDNGNGVTADQDGVAGSPTIVLGDVVIWNLLHFQLTDAALLDGTDPATNTAAYTILDKVTYPETYVTVWDISEFDFANQIVIYRPDLRGNLIRNSVGSFMFGSDIVNNNKSDGQASIENILFQFSGNSIFPAADVSGLNLGENSAFTSNIIQNNGQFNGISSIGPVYIRFNNVGQAAQIGGGELAIKAGTIIADNILENSASLKGITAGANCSVSRNKIGQGATLGGSTTMGDAAQINENEIGPNATIGNCVLSNEATIVGNYLGANTSLYDVDLGQFCTISGLTIVVGGEVSSLTLESDGISGSQIIDTQFVVGGRLSNKTFAPGVQFSGNTIGVPMTETETITDNIEGKRAIPGFSDIPGTIDISGLNVLDCTAAWAQYRGIYLLESSNATEAIDTITNPPTLFPTILKNNQPGLALTITGTPYAGIAAGQIALKAASYTLYPGEYIVLDYDPATGCLIENRVVNGLI